MSEVLSKIRKELYKLSEIDFDKEEVNSTTPIKEFINSIFYLRSASEEEIINKFKPIFISNKEESIKFLFFVRSINSGLGERRIFRVLLKYLAKENPNIIANNIRIIPKYGRWDDLYSLYDTPLEEKVIYLFKSQIQKDLSSNSPSTLGKWLKSENASSKESKMLAYKTRTLLNYSSKEYRKLLSSLRRKLNLIETNLSSKEYKNINYEKLSKVIIRKYEKSFYRNDKENYSNFIKSKFKNEKFKPNKIIYYINSNIYKYNLNKSIDDLLFNIVIKDSKILEDSLIINGVKKDDNKEVVSLLLFTIVLYKKINLNDLKNYYMSFKKNPKFNKLSESNPLEDIKSIYKEYTNFNISLNSALDLLLFTLIKKNIATKSAPKSILYIYNNEEDLEFQVSEDIKENWLKAGFDYPKIKLWNLKNLKERFSITKEKDIIKISGYSQNIWPYLLEAKEISNCDIILNKYKKINFRDIII